MTSLRTSNITDAMQPECDHAVLVVHHLPIVRMGLLHVVVTHSDMGVLGETDKFDHAGRLLARSERPVVALIDPDMESGRGYAFIKEASRDGAKVQCATLSVRCDHSKTEKIFKAGAMAILTQRDSVSALLAGLVATAAGKKHMSPCATEDLGDDLAAPECPSGDAVQRLSKRELEIFRLVGRGGSVKEVALATGVSPRTVESHLDHIRRKLGLDNNGELRRMAIIGDYEQRSRPHPAVVQPATLNERTARKMKSTG